MNLDFAIDYMSYYEDKIICKEGSRAMCASELLKEDWCIILTIIQENMSTYPILSSFDYNSSPLLYLRLELNYEDTTMMIQYETRSKIVHRLFTKYLREYYNTKDWLIITMDKNPIISGIAYNNELGNYTIFCTDYYLIPISKNAELYCELMR
jgi:histone deacetylase complex regulatory component SIN3